MEKEKIDKKVRPGKKSPLLVGSGGGFFRVFSTSSTAEGTRFFRKIGQFSH
ncbi:unnamed protein product, partial [Nesidiocoris tenuis]